MVLPDGGFSPFWLHMGALYFDVSKHHHVMLLLFHSHIDPIVSVKFPTFGVSFPVRAQANSSSSFNWKKRCAMSKGRIEL